MDILRILPLLDTIFMKDKQANGTEIKQWQVTKFHALRDKITRTDHAKIKGRESYFRLKTIAKNIGHATLFDSKKEPTPRKEPKPYAANTIFSCILDWSIWELRERVRTRLRHLRPSSWSSRMQPWQIKSRRHGRQRAPTTFNQTKRRE